MYQADWDFITAVPVRVEDYYAFVAPTLSDSTIADGLSESVFMVSALTATPGVFFDSPPDSGYSVDNLAPNVPANIVAGYQADGVDLGWDDALAADYRNFRIYRSTTEGFVPSPANLVQEVTASAWTDPVASPWSYHYKITAVDFAGNESAAGWPGTVSGVHDSEVPVRTALLGAAPNPFNPRTKLSFALAAPGHALLTVYDPAGHLVVTLVDETRPAGRHEVIWDGRDTTGRMVAAGVYLYRMVAPGYHETKRMVLVKYANRTGAGWKTGRPRRMEVGPIATKPYRTKTIFLPTAF